MKSVRHILIAIAASLSFASCERSDLWIDENELPIFWGYMQFSTDVNKGISTRAQLATNMRSRSFGVMGYQYVTTTNWATAKPLAKPETFYNQQVACDASGVCTYDIDNSTVGNQLKPWEDRKYSFFAYQPYGGEGITLSGKDLTNTPTLIYEYSWLNDATTSIPAYGNTKIFDLMTAEAIDVNASTGPVDLEFKHRLFAIEVLANNFNENTEGTIDARQTITNLTLTLSGLKNKSMTIPLSMQEGETDPIYDGISPSDVMFQISNQAVTIPAFNETITDETTGETRGSGVASSISRLGSQSGDGYLMFIPQDNAIKFEFNWEELADIIEGNNNSAEIQTSFTSDMEFKAGLLYQVIINFVGDGITIAIIEAGSWDQHEVYHTFE